MPGSKLSKNDFMDESFLKGVQDARKEIRGLLTDFKKLAKEAKTVSDGIKLAKTFNEVTKAAKKTSDTTKKLTAEERKLERVTKALAFENSKAGKEWHKINEAKKLAAKKNRELTKALNDTTKATKKHTGVLKSFQFRFNLAANVVSSFVSFTLRKLKQGLKDAFDVVVKFDKAMADVKSITKASKSDMDKLTKSAKALGGTTIFTAAQVAGLQKEYAKLGLTTQQILNAQAATLDLAAATSTELPRAAEVVGITLKQFKLNAKEAGRVTDVMAESFTSSALDMEKFAESMKFVGPAARASGLSLEQTTAYLAKLADAGISGSMAGTSLRQIMLALSKETGTFSEKLERASKSGLDLAGASEEVQKRAATSLLVLADGIDTIDDYTESLENAAGASQAMADIQLDTLEGKITLVKSAWEGMILSMLSTEENLSGVKWALQGIVNLLNVMAIKAEAEAISSEKHSKRTTKIRIAQAAAINKMAREAEQYAITLQKGQKAEKEFIDGFKNIGKWAKDFGADVWEEWFPKPEEIEEQAERIPQILKESLLKFSKEEQEIFDEITHDIAEQFGILAPMTSEELDLLNEIIQDNTKSMLDGITEQTDQFNKEAVDNTKERVDKEIEQEERLAKAVRMAEELKRDLKMATANEFFNFTSTLFDRQIANVEKQEAAEVISAEQAAKKKAEIQKKQAVVDKAQSLFNIGITTAEGVMNYASNPITAPLVPWIIALGLAQAATVIATPIPAFAKGTDSAPGGLAVAGEKGSELMIGPDGKIGLTPDSATLMDIDKGTKIFPADITKELLRYTTVANGVGSKDDRVILAVMQKMDASNERLYQAIKNKPVSSSTLTPAGIRTMIYKGNTSVKRIDKYFK